MRKLVFLFAVLFIPTSAGLSLLDCSKEKVISNIDPGYTIGGFVKDIISGMPIDSAWIDIDDSTPPYRAYTDSIGYYETIVFLGGELVVFSGKEGYYIKNTTINLNTNLDSINFELLPKK